MVRQWGFVHIPIGTGKPQRAEVLVGYPFASGFAAPEAPPPPLGNIFRIDATGACDTFRGSSGGGRLFRQ